MVTEAPPKMDDTFQSPNVGRPPDGKPIELWHGGGIVKGYKKDGSWHAEDGTNITVEGWRLIGAKPPAKPDDQLAAPAVKDDKPEPAHRSAAPHTRHK